MLTTFLEKTMPTFDERYKAEAEYLFDARWPLEIRSPGGDWEDAPQEIADFVYSSIDKSRAEDLASGTVEFSDRRCVRFRQHNAWIVRCP